jgi:hypothetical protein
MKPFLKAAGASVQTRTIKSPRMAHRRDRTGPVKMKPASGAYLEFIVQKGGKVLRRSSVKASPRVIDILYRQRVEDGSHFIGRFIPQANGIESAFSRWEIAPALHKPLDVATELQPMIFGLERDRKRERDFHHGSLFLV